MDVFLYLNMTVKNVFFISKHQKCSLNHLKFTTFKIKKINNLSMKISSVATIGNYNQITTLNYNV